MTLRSSRTYNDLRKDKIPEGFPLTPLVLHTADANRQKRRALIKAVGARQFKKLYRKTP